MKNFLYRTLSCMLLIAAAVGMGNATISDVIRYEDFTLCYGDTLSFNNGAIKVANDTAWRDTIAGTPNPEDSVIFVYNVHVTPLTELTETRELLVGSTIQWRGLTIDRPGDYEKTYTSQYGCDSMIVRLTVVPKYTTTYHYVMKDTTICEGGFIDWRGKRHELASMYIDTVHAADPSDRDTLYVLNLHVSPRFYKTELLETASFPFVYRGETFTTAGETKEITYLSSFGCDSTYRVTVNQQVITLHDYAVICAGKDYLWPRNSETYEQTGNYYHYVKSADNQRDSITYVLHLTVNPVLTTYISADICDGLAYNFGGSSYTKSGVYTKKFQTSFGCDSTVVLTLNVHYADTTDTVAYIEQGGSITWGGHTYSAEGTYERTYSNRFGCDSVARLILTTHRVDTIDTVVVLCPNEEITWHGITANNSGVYSRYEQVDASRGVIYRMDVTAKKLRIEERFFTICDDNPVSFLDSTFDKAGTYDVYYTCDTLYRVTITKPAIAVRTFSATYNGTGTYIWKFNHEGVEKSFSCDGAGTYEQRLDNSTTGCKDLYILHLAVDSLTHHYYDTLTVCEGAPFEWQGYTTLSSEHVGEAYDYTKGYKTLMGKDSVYHLHLTVLPKKYAHIGTVVFASFPQNFLGKTVTGPGLYTASIAAANGCDSVVTFAAQRLVVRDSIAQTICEGESFNWRNNDYTIAGQYNEIEPAEDGSDSVLHILKLDVLQKVNKQVYKQLCQGDSYTSNGKTYTQTGVYRDTLNSANGCDSIVELHLNFLSKDTITIVRTKAAGDTVMCWGRSFVAPTLFDTVLQNQLGCDSIVRLLVTEAAHVDTVAVEGTVCHGEGYHWFGNDYYTAGVYTHVDTTVAGSVTFHRLTLYVNGVNKIYRPVPVTICQGKTYQHFDSIYSKAGTYLYPYSCDTIDSIVLTVNPISVSITRATFNGNDPYIWKKADNGTANDTTITEAGTYEKEVLNGATGCFDIYRLYLALDTASYHYEEIASKCYGEPMTWHGQDLSNRNIGTHDDIYYITKTVNGNDSIHHLTLTVLPTYSKTESVNFSSFPVRYRDSLLVAAGTYEFHYLAQGGCDSLITVIASKRTLVEEETARICQGEEYPWHGNIYNATGDYTIRDTTLNGDTVDYTLHLTVANNADSILNITLCRGNSYIFGGQTYSQAGVYRHTYPKDGCEAMAILTLNIVDPSSQVINRTIAKGDSIEFNGQQYREPGDYEFHTTNMYGCDSVTILHLSFIQTDTIRRSDTICPGETYEWFNHSFTTGGEHSWIETQPNGNKTRYELTLFVREQVTIGMSYSICAGDQITIDGQTFDNDTIVYINHSCDTTYKITVSKHLSLMKVYNASFDGTSYHWINNEAGIDTTVTEAGTYFKYRVNPTTGCTDTHRLILTEVKPDEQTYSFEEAMTVCEGSEVIWRDRHHDEWSRQGIGQTRDYYDRYTTVYGKDSIYHLALTVQPVSRTTRTIPFCAGETVSWNTLTITNDTVVVDTFKTSTGCDSIATIVFVKGAFFRIQEQDSIALGDVLEWHGKTITTDGLYEDIHQSSLGCDSSYVLTVTLKQETPSTKTRTFRHTMCDGDVYTWGTKNRNYRETGIYYDTIMSGTEIDSIHILHLTVNPTYYITESITFPRAQFPVTYRGHKFSAPDTAEIHYISSLGCDSTINVIVNYQHTTFTEEATICAGEMYPWHGQAYSEAGTYTYRLMDGKGYDSVTYVLNLKVKYIPVTRVDETICSGDTYNFGGKTLNESGTYTHTFQQGGCDSTVILTLHVQEPIVNTTIYTLNPGASINWKDSTYKTTGVYYHYDNSGTCPITDVLILTVNHVDTIDTVATVCPKAVPFVWHGISASQSGQYTHADTIGTNNWKFYRLDLTIREQVTIDTTFTICDGETVSFNGQTYSDRGHYVDNYNNCDTVYDIYINKFARQVYVENGSLNGTEEGYKWSFWCDGRHVVDSIFKEPGTYEYTSPNETTGCKDTWRLILTKDYNEYHFEEHLTICEGDDFTWHGLGDLSRVPGENIYHDDHQTRTGLDSTYTLYLTVKPAVRTERTIHFCGSHEWKGQVYTNTTVVYDTLTATNSCDSIVRLTLTKVQSFFDHDTATIMEGEILEWHGQLISTSGLYRDPNTNSFGCDSTYEIGVGLIPVRPQDPVVTTKASICSDDSIFWRGQWHTIPGFYKDSTFKHHVHHPDSVDSVYVLNLTVWPVYEDTTQVQHLYACGENAMISYQGKEYTSDTVFVNYLHTIHGCDSLVKVYLHFNTSVYHSDTVKIADTQLPYTWTYKIADGLNRDTVITEAGGGSGTYHHSVLTEGGCYDTEELVLFVYPTYLYCDTVTICETETPYHWMNGPIEHQNRDLQHTVGQTKMYEYRYQTVAYNTDSIYRLYLTIDKAPKDTIQVYLCEGEQVKVGDKTYYMIQSDSVYRDTLYKSNPNNGCDSIIYYEIYQYPQKKIIETAILHKDSTINWKGNTITHGGDYNASPDSIDAATGCKIVQQLHVVQENPMTVSIFACDTPYIWRGDTLYTSGIWTDTILDANGMIKEYHSLDLEVKMPIDTTRVLRGCQPEGVTWNGVTYLTDTIFRDTLATCDTLFTIKIHVDTTYKYIIRDTICEHELPYVLGRQNPQEIWSEGHYFHKDTTACGCDSTIDLRLFIMPSLEHSDSTFRCEKDINENPVILGDTVHPRFAAEFGGNYTGEWRGKWHGIEYKKDTIVYNCDSTAYHHIIVRPHQEQPRDTTYYLCKGDSVQLFWPKETWVKSDGIYLDTVMNRSAWEDSEHNMIHNDYAFACDSMTRWTVIYADTIHEDTIAHIAMGDSMRWDGRWYYTTGVYDSIAQAPDTNTLGQHCKAIYTLHLFVDSTYYYRDTLEICEFPGKQIQYTWNDGFTKVFTLPTKDSTFHVIDSLPTTIYRFDSIYDLYVDYRQKYFRIIRDTLCYGDSIQFDLHTYQSEQNVTIERYLHEAGVYVDTLRAANHCDSIVELRLEVRDRVITKTFEQTVSDRELPFEWKHDWKENGVAQTKTDSLYKTGEYKFVMPNQYGCDSTVILNFYVHETHVFRDTVDTCAATRTTLTHRWSTGYTQTYTTPSLSKDTSYADTLTTRVPLDSIYVLEVRFHRTFETHVFDTICAGDSMHIDTYNALTPKQYYKQTGIYRDTVPSIEGCDSIITLHLQVWPGFPTTHKTVDKADVDSPYVWYHSWYDNGTLRKDSDVLNISGEYRFYMTNIHGCDSIDSLTLRFHKTYHITDTFTICQSETPYTWEHLNDIQQTGWYEHRMQTTEHYDSIRSAYIRVLPTLYDTIRRSICSGDSIIFGLKHDGTDNYLHTDGRYNDTCVSKQYGCDSITTLYLTVNTQFLSHVERDIADVDTPFVWHHSWYENGVQKQDSDSFYAAGEYRFIMPSVAGCDSIDSLTLRIHKTYVFRDTVTICSSETPYTWYNDDSTQIYKNDIYETGTYYKHLQTQDHYDSTYIRFVKVLPVKFTTIRDSICAGDGNFFTYKGQNLTEGGTYIDTLTAANGCDSIVTLILTVNQPYYSFREEHIVEGQVVNFNGLTFDKDTVYTRKGVTPSGCDSTTVLKVVVHPMVDTTVIVCSYDLPYKWINKWNGQEKDLYTAGIYRNDTTFINGERMFYGLQLIVNEPVNTVIHDSICGVDNNFYSFNGQKLTQSGVYTYTTTAANGCDSTVTLHLSVNQPYYSFREEHIVEGQTLNIYGQSFTRDTLYIHNTLTPSGCDSTTVLNVKVHPAVDTIVTVCQNDLPYMWINKWNPSQVTPLYTAGIYRNDTTYIGNDRMFYGLKLVVNNTTDTTIYKTVCEGTTFQFGGRDITAAGEYRDTLVNANGCDSVIILHLNYTAKYHHTIERSIFEGDTVQFYGETYSTTGNYPIRLTTNTGCDSIVELILTVNKLFDDSISICFNELPLVWHNKTIYESGIVRDTVINSLGKQTIIGLKVNVLPISRRPEPILDTICQGDFYQLGSRRLTEGGTSEDTLTAVNGCDSIVSLVLQVMPAKNVITKKTIFEGDSTEFNGTWIKTSGIYSYSVKNENNCYDTYQLVLNVVKSFSQDTTAYICENDLPFIWRGKTYWQSCVDSVPTWTDSTRVMTALHLTVYPKFYETRNISICQNDTFHFAKLDKIITESGTFEDTIPSSYGCDSIIHYVISVHPTYDRTIIRTISDQQSYNFHGRILKYSGTYKWDTVTIHGCDSTEHLVLNVQPSYHFNETQHLCLPDTIYWHGKVITSKGVYCDSLTTVQYGFDSIYTLNVYEHPSYNINERIEIVEGYTTHIHGIDVSKPGLYHDTLYTAWGCDSIYHIQVNTKRTLEQTQFIQTCQGDTIDFYGQKLTRTGTYKHTSQHGDTTITLKLTVNPITIVEKLVVIERDELPYIYEGAEYWKDTLYIINEGTNSYGCDSILRMNLVIANYVSPWDQMPLCPGKQIRIDDKIITEPGQYTFIRRSVQSGKRDSLYRVEVYAAPAYEFDVARTICYGDTIYYGDKAITRGGKQDVLLKTHDGCDSIYHLDITVNPSYHFITDTTIVDYETYVWKQDNRSYNKTGEYHRTWQTILDCDSTYTLRLTVDSTIRQHEDVAICVGDSYPWRGRTLTDDGYYVDTVRVAATHFSAIYSLRLVVAYPSYVTSARAGEVCADEDGFDIQFEYSGYTPSFYSIHFGANAKNAGFQDIYNAPIRTENTAHVDLPTYSAVCYQGHPYYVRPDKYTLSIVLDNGVCGISRSNDIEFTVKYPSWILEQNWDDVVAVLSAANNGGFEFSQIDWWVNDIYQTNTGGGYLHSDKLRPGDQVMIKATRKGENYAIASCPFTIAAPLPPTNDEPVIVYPSNAPRHTPAFTIRAPHDGSFAIYASTGMLISSGELQAGETTVTLPTAAGVYFIRVRQGEETTSHKVILY